MAANKKYKRLTNREKKLNKEVRAEMRAEGLLPPVKPKLNRKKFSKEVISEFRESFKMYSDLQHLNHAIAYMLPLECERIGPEQIGVVKVLKLALEIKKYMQGKINQGETKYSECEMFEQVVKPVRDL